MSTNIISRPFKPSKEKCCEACVFGGEHHESWCKTLTLMQFNELYVEPWKAEWKRAADKFDQELLQRFMQ